jgi:prolipoprotein diacylglyceryltransferase
MRVFYIAKNTCSVFTHFRWVDKCLAAMSYVFYCVAIGCAFFILQIFLFSEKEMVFMLPEITILGHALRLYDLCGYLGYLSVPIIMFCLRKRYGFSIAKTIFCAVVTLICGVIAHYGTAAIENKVMEIVTDGAFEPFETMSSFGFWVFIAPIFLLVCLRFSLDYRSITDIIAPCLCVVTSLGKFACFFNGCCAGPQDIRGIYMVQLGYKCFPIQLYEALFYFAFFIIILVLTFTFSKKHIGYLMPISGMLYSVVKIWAENYRTWPSEFEQNFLYTGHTYWQFFLLITFYGCLIWLIATYILEKKGKQPDFVDNNTLRRKWHNRLQRFEEKIK